MLAAVCMRGQWALLHILTNMTVIKFLNDDILNINEAQDLRHFNRCDIGAIILILNIEYAALVLHSSLIILF